MLNAVLEYDLKTIQRLMLGAAALAMLFAGPLAIRTFTLESLAQSFSPDAVPIRNRNVDMSREAATKLPRSEKDQAVADGWPIYRTERGQAAFNDAMATLKATDDAAPAPQVFKGCAKLECNVTLPAIGSSGWIPAGRLWVSASEYVVFAQSPRLREGQSYRRRSYRSMDVFVFHEFHNSSGNTDTYDTISSHSGRVFVPFYMTKQGTDAKGRQFVVVVQVAPYDVVSVHAVNHGSAGPGIEVAKNGQDELEPLQAQAGILVAAIVTKAAPHIEVVNHRGAEGLPMLEVYKRRLAALQTRSSTASITLPFVPAVAQRITAAAGKLDDVLWRRGTSPPPPRIPVAERTIVPPKPTLLWQR